MSSITVGKRYAKSLFDLALEKGQLEELFADMSLVKKVTDESRELRVMLASPVIKHDKKRDIMTAIFEGKVSDMTNRMFGVLAKKQREDCLDEMAWQFIELYKEYNDISDATVITADELSPENEAKLVSLMEQELGLKNIRLTKKIDNEILGGYTLKFNHKMIDESVRGRLSRLKNSIDKNLIA